jgi:hypothetical protein
LKNIRRIILKNGLCLIKSKPSDLFACESPIFTPSPPHGPPPHHHQQQYSPTSANENVKRADAENAFQAVAEEIRKRDMAAQKLAKEIEELRFRMGSIEATSPSSDPRRKKVSRTTNSMHATGTPPGAAVISHENKPASVPSNSSGSL